MPPLFASVLGAEECQRCGSDLVGSHQHTRNVASMSISLNQGQRSGVNDLRFTLNTLLTESLRLFLV